MLPERIREYRKNLGISQEQLATMIGKRLGRHLSKEVIGTYERGDRDVSTEVLVAMADVFHVSTDTLLARDENEGLSVEEELDQLGISISLMSKNKTMSDPEKKKLLATVKAGWPELFHNDDK